MGLTQRTQDFLGVLRRLCDERHAPVHYEDVARTMGVSKWTAYDVLRRLARQGLVRSEYVLNRRARMPGRSIVVFSPRDPVAPASPDAAARDGDVGGADVTEDVTQGSSRASAFRDELRGIRERLLGWLADSRGRADAELWDGMAEALDLAKRPAVFCGYMVALLLACARLLGEVRLDAVMRLAEGAADAHSALTLFCGAVVGLLMVSAPEGTDLSSKVARYARRFQNHVDNLDGTDRDVLFELVREMARKGGVTIPGKPRGPLGASDVSWDC